MIVCHCNVVLKAEVQAAVRSILAADPSAGLEPQLVLKELQKRGRCCSCFPTVSTIVADLLASAMDELEGDALVSRPVLEKLTVKSA